MRLMWLRTLLLMMALFACLNGAWAQTYPLRPVRFIVPFPPGGANDMLNKATRAALSKPELKGKLLAVGVESVDTTTGQFRQFLLVEMKKWDKVVKTLNITAQ